ncbi:signal peptidase I [Candidatus Raskinella chloraquaticus]|jgi:signal peptidase I|uniref:Signal peptidase I n=1 Tax=Candidatus Raskinella chloraquaticus TaxID=1951219 RepID=A0A1W9HR74_9HYPH|nr:MAG: S26 family signal peptidase [Proteobacteria bacterium SG_bin8]
MTVESKADDKRGGIIDTVIVVLEALVIALVIRSLLFQPFNIPSGSMKATLLVGDYLFVSKFAYGYSRHSFPFSIVPIPGRIWSAPPERGDVVVFKLPSDVEIDYIKRVIGLPGDRIQMIGGLLHINGKPVKRERAEDYVMPDAFGRLVSVRQYRETLPEGRTFYSLKLSENGYLDNTEVFQVPPGHYFMMGDNRDNSQDSRVLNAVGYVPFENLVGRASFIFFSLEEGEAAWQLWRWPWIVRWDRIGKAIW